MDEFDQWLIAKGIDCIGMTTELRRAMEIQWQAEQPMVVVEPLELVGSRLMIPDGCDGDPWARGVVRLAVPT